MELFRLFAYAGDRNDGAYSIHLRHMLVDLPHNSSCEDLNLHGPDFNRPDSEPTTMSFHLQRIRIASVCREILDALPYSFFSSEPTCASYDMIPGLDNKFNGLIDSLPAFLRPNLDSDAYEERGGDLDLRIASQRACLNLMIHSRRCKLHLPFLLRFKSNPRYAFSRDLCLQSAHAVLQVGHRFWLENSQGAFSAYYELASNLQHIFFATVVLLMDISVNEHRDSTQLRQIHEAIELIGAARGSSLMSSVFYESLMNVLQKHQMELPGVKSKHDILEEKNSRSTAMFPNSDELEVRFVNSGFQSNGEEQVSSDDLMASTDPAFDDVWQQFLDAGASMNVQSWDALLNDLEMHTA